MKRKTVKAVMAFCMASAVIAALFLGGYIVTACKEERQTEKIRPVLQEYPAGRPDAAAKRLHDPYRKQWKKLYAKNRDFAAWLKVPGTKVDYPVMQRKGSPEYYLHRDFDGRYSASGTPFLSAACDIGSPSGNLIIYGHHMRSGLMFASLTKFTERGFHKKHHEILLLTKEGLLKFRIFSVFRAQVGAGGRNEFRYYEKSGFEDETDFNKFMDGVRKRQYYDTGSTAHFGDRLIMLSTCEYSLANGRLVVLGALDNGEGG